MSRTREEQAVIDAACAWWRSHRPVAFTLKQHLDNPEINAGYTNYAAALARAVGRYTAASEKGSTDR